MLILDWIGYRWQWLQITGHHQTLLSVREINLKACAVVHCLSFDTLFGTQQYTSLQ